MAQWKSVRQPLPSLDGDPDSVFHAKMHQWADRIARLMADKGRAATSVSRSVIDASLEPYRIYYRQRGAVRGDSDEGMMRWYHEQAA